MTSLTPATEAPDHVNKSLTRQTLGLSFSFIDRSSPDWSYKAAVDSAVGGSDLGDTVPALTFPHQLILVLASQLPSIVETPHLTLLSSSLCV